MYTPEIRRKWEGVLAPRFANIIYKSKCIMRPNMNNIHFRTQGIPQKLERGWGVDSVLAPSLTSYAIVLLKTSAMYLI